MRVRVDDPLARPVVGRVLVHVGMRVVQRAVRMRVGVEVAPPPAHEQPQAERHDHEADRDFGGALHSPRQCAAEEHDGDSEQEQRRRVPEAPGRAERGRAARSAIAGPT